MNEQDRDLVTSPAWLSYPGYLLREPSEMSPSTRQDSFRSLRVDNHVHGLWPSLKQDLVFYHIHNLECLLVLSR